MLIDELWNLNQILCFGRAFCVQFLWWIKVKVRIQNGGVEQKTWRSVNPQSIKVKNGQMRFFGTPEKIYRNKKQGNEKGFSWQSKKVLKTGRCFLYKISE